LKSGDAVDAEDHGRAIDDELLDPVATRRGRDPGIAARPVMAAAGDEAHRRAIALDAEAVTIIFDFVEPGFASGDALAVVGRQNSKRGNIAPR
jgi:hypothetical protein